MKKSQAYHDALDRVFSRLETMTDSEFEILLNRQDILALDYLKPEYEAFEPEEGFEPMDIYSDSGTKVKFMNRNGFESDRNYAIDSGLWTTEVYTVDYVRTGGWSCEVFLKEFPGQGFNTVMFKEVK